MLSNTELNKKFKELMKKKSDVEKVVSTIRDVTSDLNIKIANENVQKLEELIELTGQYKVLKADFVSSYETLDKQLQHIGFDEDVSKAMLYGLKFENWKNK